MLFKQGGQGIRLSIAQASLRPRNRQNPARGHQSGNLNSNTISAEHYPQIGLSETSAISEAMVNERNHRITEMTSELESLRSGNEHQREVDRLAITVITELFAADMFGLRVLWNKHLPEADLEKLANELGYSFD